MTSVISRGPTPVSSQLSMAAEAIADTQQPATLSDRFDGVVSGEALQATLTSSTASGNLQLNSQAQAQLQAAVAAIATGDTNAAVTAVASATRAQGITTYHVNTASCIRPDNSIEWRDVDGNIVETADFLPLDRPARIGVTSGASTPDSVVQECLEAISMVKKLSAK